MTSSQSRVACHRLSALGLKNDVKHQILNLIDRWVNESGVDWTVSRLKAYKQLYVQMLAGEKPRTDHWISTKVDGVPRGPLGYLWKHKSYRFRVRALNSLMVYTGFQRTRVSTSDMRKCLSSVAQKVDRNQVLKHPPVRNQPSIFRKAAFNRVIRKNLSFQTLVRNEAKASLHLSGRSCSQTDLNLDSILKTMYLVKDLSSYNPGIESLLNRVGPKIAEFVKRKRQSSYGLMPDKSIYDISVKQTMEQCRGLFREVQTYDGIPNIVGRVAFLAEPGLKTRMIAIPHICVQHLLNPMGSELFRTLRYHPFDCTYDQQKGVAFAQESLSEGKTVFCVDLSSATDNFPLEYQLKVLTALGIPDDDISLFRTVSRGVWKLPRKVGPYEAVSWTKGQPMGLYPSFASFAISHHYLMESIEDELGLKGTYRILGDDIVISNREVHERYRECLSNLAVPVSELKCLTSNRYAEFAGSLITKDGVLPTFKHRRTSDRNFLDVVKALGRPAIGLLSNSQRRVLQYCAALPEPWGLGWNSLGLSLDQRIHGRELIFNTDIKTDSLQFSKFSDLESPFWGDVQTVPKSYFDFIKDLETSVWGQKEKTFSTYRESVSVMDTPVPRIQESPSDKLNKLIAKYPSLINLEFIHPGGMGGNLTQLYEDSPAEGKADILYLARVLGYTVTGPLKGGDPRPNICNLLNERINEQVSLNQDRGIVPNVANRFEINREKEERRRLSNQSKPNVQKRRGRRR